MTKSWAKQPMVQFLMIGGVLATLWWLVVAGTAGSQANRCVGSRHRAFYTISDPELLDFSVGAFCRDDAER